MILDFLKDDATKRKELFYYLQSNAKPAKPENFPKGSRVFIIEGYHDPRAENVNESTIEFVASTVQGFDGGNMVVNLDSGYRNWYLSPEGLVVDVQHLDNYLAKHNAPIELDTAQLDKLVLEGGAKSEILAVLKQHKNLATIFDEWGLGELLEYGKSMSLLFYGVPGTGKTWGAHCIAKALQKELLVISAANIQTSEPGGANRNIEQAFEQARVNGNVLFFDECDGLITDRAQVGIILASEINTLLTCLEKYEGVVIFATNRADTLDPAMARRISLMVEFPKPDEATRLQIWETLLPEKMPLAKDVDLKKLAKFEMTGGYIKNVILNAARYASADEAKEVTKVHFARAIKRVEDTKDIMGSHTSRKSHMVRSTDVDRDVVRG